MDSINAYLDPYKLIKLAEGQELKPNHINLSEQMWYLNQAILQSSKTGKTEKIQKKLDLLSLTALYKIATLENYFPDLQASPLRGYASVYYRIGENGSNTKLNEVLAEKIGLKDFNLMVSSSPYLPEMLNRLKDIDYDSDGIVLTAKYKMVTIENMDHFENIIKEKKDFSSTCFNFNNLLKGNENQIAQVMEAIHAKMAEHGVEDQIDMFAMTEYAGQNVCIYTPGMHATLRSLLNSSGFRPTPDHVHAALLTHRSMEKILADFEVPLVDLGSPGKLSPAAVICPDFKTFLGTNAFKAFEALAEKREALEEKMVDFAKENNLPPYVKNAVPPYLKVIPKITAELLKGLEAQSLDARFEEKNLTELLQFSYFVLINALQAATVYQDDFVEFNNNIELIHHILQCILAIIEPYEDTALSDVILSKMMGGSDPILPKAPAPPLVNLKSSAMHCFSSILGAAEKQKNGAPLQVLTLRDNYFEIYNQIKHSSHSVHVVPGDIGKENPLAHPVIESTLPHSVDLFICEFQHNVSLETLGYKKQELLSFVKGLFDNNIAADQLTVAIDLTLSAEDSADLKELFADEQIQRLIHESKLNIVLFKSAQKYDLLGIDNYCGGFSVAINNPDGFKPFNNRISDKTDDVEGLSYQGIVHLQRYGNLDVYRHAIIDNTQLFYKLVEPLSDRFKQFVLQFAETNEDYPLVILKHKAFGKFAPYGFLDNLMHDYAKKQGFLLTPRDSFGFMTMNLNAVGKDMLRISPGLESRENMQKMADLFLKIDQILAEIESEKGFKDKPELSEWEEETLAKELMFRLMKWIDQMPG